MDLFDIKIGNLESGILLELKDINISGEEGVYDALLFYNIKTENFTCENNLASCHSKDLLKFLKDLSDMHKNLSGETSLAFYDKPSFINIKYINNGNFLFSGEIHFISYTPSSVKSKYYFSFTLDQSYLADICAIYKSKFE